MWRLLGGLGEAVVAGPGSLRGLSLCLLSPAARTEVTRSTAEHKPSYSRGKRFTLFTRVKSFNTETQPSSVCQEKKRKEPGLGRGLLPWPAGYGHGVHSLL